MRENRPYGSEGGEGDTLPDPYRRSCQPYQILIWPTAHGKATLPIFAAYASYGVRCCTQPQKVETSS